MIKKYREWLNKANGFEKIGENAIMILGDSAEILKDTELAVDSAIMDPPYDFDAAGGAGLFKREGKNYFHDLRERGLANGFDARILDYCSSADQLVIFFHNAQAAAIINSLTEPRSVLKPYDEEELQYFGSIEEPLYPKYCLCFWQKDNPMPVANKNYCPDTELYLHAWRPPAHPQGSVEELKRAIYAPVGKSEWEHPTVKPQKIMRKIVKNASKAGDVVLDPFAGSASTGVAALSLGRKFIGIEKDPEFYQIAITRLKMVEGELPPELKGQASLF